MQALGVIGSLSRDLVDGRAPRPGGAAYYGARALRVLGRRAVVVTKCAPEHRTELLSRLVAYGLPVSWHPACATTTFSFSFAGDARRMRVEEVGDPWTRAELDGTLRHVRWLHVGALLRSDFPPTTLAALARGRTLSLDGQALVRPGKVGPLELDGDFDRELLRHVQIVKLSEEEARALLGEVSAESVRRLRVPEVVVTLGSHGSVVLARGREERLTVEPLARVDPTGAGDSFAAAYLAARSSGHSPAAAARRASALVAGLLGGRLR